MRIIVIDFISLDGVVQAPGGQGEDDDGGFKHGGWSGEYFDTEVMGQAIDGVMQETESLLYGRRTWDVMASAWPGRAGDPFADRMNEIEKHVASRTLSADDVSSRWTNSHLLEGDAMAAVGKLRERPGDGAMQVWGSSSFARQLIENDLVDELALLIEPVILGGGKSIFPTDGTKRGFELISVTPANTGVLVARYRRAKD